MLAIICFALVVVGTIAITRWAAKQASGREGLYAANGNLSAKQNGLAITGDFVSASTLLGTTAIYFGAGADSVMYLIPFLLGLCMMLAWISGPLRSLGRFTLGDVISSRLNSQSLRVFSGINTITISLIYLVAQLVGAGLLISVLFGLTFEVAVIIVGVLMAIYVTFGGMVAATWVQVIKATILIAAIGIMVVLCLVKGGGLSGIYTAAAEAHPLGERLFSLGNLDMGLFSTISLVVGLMLGTMGLPHLLIRSFTVKDARESQKSVAYASALIALLLATIYFIIQPATVAFVTPDARFHDASGALIGGANMAVVHLATAVGGEPLFGAIAAVAFATILAVVAGLTVTVASAASHDIYATIARRTLSTEGHELGVFRAAAIGVSILAVFIAILLQDQNIAVLVTCALVLAASANFPILFLVIYWPRLTIAGAISGGLTGLISTLILLALSPNFWVTILGNEEAIFPAEYPTLITMPLAFITAITVSLITKPYESDATAVEAA